MGNNGGEKTAWRLVPDRHPRSLKWQGFQLDDGNPKSLGMGKWWVKSPNLHPFTAGWLSVPGVYLLPIMNTNEGKYNVVPWIL